MKAVVTKVSAIIFAMLLATNVFAADSFSIDLSHSTIGFTATHLTVSKVNGQFTDYVGTIEFDPQDLASFKADVVIKTASVNTGVNDRDDHLRKEEFFDAPKYPTITFKSSLLEKKDEGYVLRGDLTIRDVTKQVAIPVTISGPVKSPYGQQVIGLVGRFTINRQDFGVKWNKIMDNGGFVVGDDVDILVNVEASK